MEIAWREKGKKSSGLLCLVLCVFSGFHSQWGEEWGVRRRKGNVGGGKTFRNEKMLLLHLRAVLFLEQVQTKCRSGKNLSPNLCLLVTTITTKPNSVQQGGGGCLYNVWVGSHTVASPLRASHAPYWRKQARFRITEPQKFPLPSNSLLGEPVGQRGRKVPL